MMISWTNLVLFTKINKEIIWWLYNASLIKYMNINHQPIVQILS
jgi:hypothetical protein